MPSKEVSRLSCVGIRGAFVHTFNTIAHFQDLAPLQAVDVGHLFYVVEAAGDGKVGGDSFFNKGREEVGAAVYDHVAFVAVF